MLASSNISQQTKSKKHAGGKHKHYLTEYIIITDEYVNPQKPNAKYCYCLACHESNSEKEQAKNILNKEELEASKKLRLDEEEESSDDNSLVSSKSETQFEDQILNITITNGWSFCWVEDKNVIAYYRWLNPHLALPSCKQLAGRILKSATDTN
ncbi:23162_t:CDS:2 [Dentiscutata erythropus]|uniref:23162_t:CDS:1 n=1 Tax=Dentiscutata erythropus TaxID=1348616 RepID=A0A9N9NQ73_9GLOM|nr:23162_t:CDS:2 [Dentiscutata erythropus]